GQLKLPAVQVLKSAPALPFFAAMDKALLNFLVCPVSGAALQPADAEMLTRVNTAIAAGEARYVDGSQVESLLDEALLTVDGHTLYRIDDGIPMMLPDRGIEAP